jgi:ubiquinone/menaquinone biosynthesis C-methylase UbiE
MVDWDTIELNRSGWDTISAQYQARTRISTTDVHYGPLGLGERELGLLGDVAGKRTIEIGCGGGQNSIVLAKWGATATGLDPSARQIGYARDLAEKEGVEVTFLEGVAEELTSHPDEGFDIALSSYALDYVSDLEAAFREAWRVLVPGGIWVFCLSHPWFQAVGWYLSGDPEEPDIRDYSSWPENDEWDWTYSDGTSARMRDQYRTLAQIVNGLLGAGFLLERIVEQGFEDIVGDASAAERLPYVDDTDPGSGEYRIGRKLPGTLVIRARKPGS